MRRLILICVLVGCGTISLYQDASNLLDKLVALTNNPSLVTPSTADEVHQEILWVLDGLDATREKLKRRGATNRVLEVIDHLKIAWTNISEDLCTSKEAWLRNPEPIDEDVKLRWHKFLREVDKHYRSINTYLEMKDV